MVMGENGDSVGAFLSEVVDRRAVLTALDGGPRSRSELEVELEVSKGRSTAPPPRYRSTVWWRESTADAN